jgi:uncharacterized Zn finger protein (UPF0148 family)
MSEVKHTCCTRVGDWLGHACGKNAKYERDGKWYCGMHDPVAIKTKREAKNAEYAEAYNARSASEKAVFDKAKETQRRADCFDELVAALIAYKAAGVGQSTDFQLQFDAYKKARAALEKSQGAQP